ncbi:hypothetical protein QQM39_26165 [Streptomyces sp. DT2A-34]|uniref:hypothetical protein n=1 Tax=Streptomyces sp. DT2A-34 TaxID=3051182 RepID=UPI00265C764D|nr:hypothetical protein [Streptomyces sp. DT2A-34]MDO0914187.1 hypothetical protein [Streptomyces sp. DT2A-34]
MNGIDHYKRAEELMAEATRTRVNSLSGHEFCEASPEEQERLTRLASVHATLALAAATADATAFKRELYRANGEELPAVKRAESKTARDAAAAAAFLD